MPIVLAHPSNSLSFRFSSHPPLNSNTSFTSFQNTPKLPLLKSQSKTLVSPKNSPVWRTTHISFCSRNDIFEDISSTQLSETPETDGVQDIEELELLGKPSPVPLDNRSASEVDSELKRPDKDEALAPFLKFFKSSDGSEEANGVSGEDGSEMSESGSNKMVSVEYYEPKPGDFVMGVVVSGNENKLDVNVGADLLGTMLTKEVLPLYDKEMEYLLCDVEKDAEEFMARGKMRIIRSDDALSWVPIQGRPVVETGTVLFAEVLGRTLSGRPLLSTRRFFRRIAWHRVRQIKQLNEPIEVRITEWNTGGLLTRIEGLRAFLPKAELLNRVKSFRELKENVGCRLYVQITRIDEAKNDLILSEKDAWEKMHLQEGTLLEGTVKKFFPYGAQIRIGETNRSGLLHISNITRARITSVSDLLAVDEKVKVLVVKSMFPNKIALSIADLESEPGLFLSNKEKVFSNAEEMAKKYRQRMPAVTATRKLEPHPTDVLLPFHDEVILYANFRWFKFERDNEPVETRKEESEE